MALIILIVVAWALTHVLKFEYTSSYVLFLVALATLSDESKLFLIPFLVIVYVQTRILEDEYKRSGLTDLKSFLKQREANYAQ